MVSLYSGSVAEINLFRSLITKIAEREGTRGGIIGLSEILADILSRLVRELTGLSRDVGLEQLRNSRGTFMQAQEALALLLECDSESGEQRLSNRKLQELARQFEIELGQVCRYCDAGRQQQQLYRAELKSTLHRLLDTVTSIVAID